MLLVASISASISDSIFRAEEEIPANSQDWN